MKNKIAFITLGLLSLSLTSCGTMYGTYKDADKYLAGNQTYEQDISVLDIDWVSGSLTLVEDETITGVKVEEVTNLTNEKELVHSYLNEGELKIKFFASGHARRSFTSFKKELTVTYKPGLTKINIDLTSGSFTANSVTSTTFDLDLTSGNAKIGKMTADTVKTDVTSGSIEINELTAKDLESDMTSGTFNVGFKSINTADFDLTSGKINMTLPTDGGKVKVSKTSGTVTTERDCTVNNNLYTFGSGAADIKVSMTSGTLKIS